MALPTKTNLETMDYSYGGVPFVSVAAKAGIDLDTLDYSYAGVPFWGLEVSGGGPQSYTLTCAAGSYSLTGTNAALTSSRTLVCEPGSGGAYPDMIVSGAGTTAVNGTYAEYGTLNGKTRYRMASTASGTGYFYIVSYGNAWYISLRGKDSDAGIQIIAGGRYSSTDNVATPDLVTTWSVSQGVAPVPTVTTAPSLGYVLTGSDVTLTYTQGAQNFTLACETGSYALTGTNAGLTSARTMACNAGSYTLTGTNADFYRALVMACEAGSYALTGSDASLTSHRIFALGMGSYVLVGTACGLFILSPTPACRTATIEYENRTFAIPHENRTATIEFENRTFAIPHENRTATIEYENRTLEVKCH